MHNRKYSYLEILPTEILFKIFDYLEPEILGILPIVNSYLTVAADSLFWKEKLKRHFPHAFNVNHTDDTLDWHSQFIKFYNSEYEGLPKDVRKLLSSIKEGDIQNLTGKLKISDLNKSDKNGYSIFSWGAKKKNQAFFNHVYQMIEKEYLLSCRCFILGSSFRDTNTICLAHTPSYNPIKKKFVHQKTILHWAILCHQPVHIIKELIKKGADTTALYEDFTPLLLAIQEGQIEVVKHLIELTGEINARCPKSGATGLLIAIENNHPEIIKLLLKNGASPSIPLEKTTHYHLSFSVGIECGDTPLHIAIKFNRIDLVKLLLEAEADIEALNKIYDSPLLVATERMNIEIIEILIKNGAKVNISFSKERFRYGGENPLHLAIKFNRIDIVKLLLESKSNVEALNNTNDRPLLVAIEKMQFDIAELLIKNGANVNIFFSQQRFHHRGESPLHLAIKLCNLGLVKCLLDHQANIDVLNSIGDTPLISAIKYTLMKCYPKITECLFELIKRGANTHHTPNQNLPSQHKTICGILKLLEYWKKLNSREDTHYKNNITFTLFDNKINFSFGYSAGEKKAATNALIDVIFNDMNKSILDEYQDILNNGELKSIYKNLCPLINWLDPSNLKGKSLVYRESRTW